MANCPDRPRLAARFSAGLIRSSAVEGAFASAKWPDAAPREAIRLSAGGPAGPLHRHDI